jgi:uroporphyrinogen decarboxylase
MTSKERFRKILAYEIPDRLPMDLMWPRGETIDALKNHFKTNSKEEVFNKLGLDFRWIVVPAKYPEFEKKVNGKLEGDISSEGEPFIFHDSQTFEDQWGIVQRIGDDGKYLEWKDGPLVGKENLKDWAPPEVIFPSVNEISKNLLPFKDFITVTEIEFPFKLAWHIAGFEHLSMMMVSNPEFIEEFYDRLYAFQTEKAIHAAQAGYDIIAVVGDVAGQLGMMFSPKLFERFDVPRFTSLIREVKKHNPEIKILYHSDGNMEEVIPNLIKCGIDILNPIQSACMDPALIKRKYGGSLTFHGTISVQDTIPNGTVEDVRDEVINRIKTVGYDGGLIVSPENSIPYDAPIENILAVYEAVNEFDYKHLKK